MRKILSILLVVLMLVGMLPMNAMHAHAAEASATLDLSNKSNRTVFNTSQQIWTQNGITITNNKSKSTSNVADYAPPRFYASSALIFECSLGNISKIEVLCDSSSYANTLKTSATNSGATASVSGSTTTITLDGSSNTFTISSLSAQVRAGNKVTVYYEEAAAACQHTNTTTATENATCTDAGSTTVTCNDCGEKISETKIPATGHNYVGGVCQNCGAKLHTVSFNVPSQVTGVDSITANESGVVTLPAANHYTVTAGAKYDYTFLGWAESSVSATETKPTVLAAGSEYTSSKDTTLYAVYTYSVSGSGSSTSAEYVQTELSAIQSTDEVIIVATKTGNYAGNYAMSNGNGTGSAPAAVEVTIDGKKVAAASVADNIIWNIEATADGYTIYPNGKTATWLYCTSSNNGLRVGTNTNKFFTLDASGYLKHNATSRYLGVYNAQDWRCYTTNTGTSNIANQTFTFYVKGDGAAIFYTSVLESADTTCQHAETTTTTVNATCTADGKTTVSCADCGALISETPIPSTGHTEVVDAAKDPTCAASGLTQGSHCSVCNTVIKEQETIAATGEHTYVDGTCSVCGGTEPSTSTMRYYIAAKRTASGSTVYYMTNTLTTSSTKRYSAVDSGSTVVPEMIEEPEADKVFVLVDNGDGTYKIYAEGLTEDARYLGHNSGNSGALVTEANAKNLTLTYNDDGTVTIAFDTRNLTLNNSSGNDYFAWYASTQANVYLIPVRTLCDHKNVVDVEAVAATCTTVGYTAGKQCEDCGEYTEGHEEVDELGHSYDDGVVTPPTATTEGYTTYTCTACENSYQDDFFGPLKFTSAYLRLRQDLSVIFCVKENLFSEGRFTKPYVVFECGYETVVVTDYEIKDGKYEFVCPHVTASQMTELISATLYASWDGVEVQGKTKEYSVAEYCLYQLENSDSAELKKLIVDMLYFGDQASKYANYRTAEDELATSILNDEQKSLHTTTVPTVETCMNTKYATVDNPTVKFTGAGLTLDHSIAIRYRFSADSLDNLYAKIEASGQTWIIDEFRPAIDKEGQYNLFFGDLPAAAMRETVLITMYQGDVAVSNTLSYSIESYIQNKLSDTALHDLLVEMIRYGDSAYNYFMKEVA